jgi:hypothetical protein
MYLVKRKDSRSNKIATICMHTVGALPYAACLLFLKFTTMQSKLAC